MRRLKINPVVFPVSAGLILLFVVLGAVMSESLEGVFGAIQSFIVTKFGWLYIGSVAFFLFFVIWLFFSRHAKVKLGKDDDEPEYSRLSWFAMLFSAGMGIGLLFFSVAEPIMHFTAPLESPPETIQAAREAMRITFFHWGLHAWAIYIVIGLSLSYVAYRHDLPLTIRSTLYPLIGNRIKGRIGDVVEILAVFGTLFGIATSLGLGVMQINAGLAHLGIMSPNNQTGQIFLIAGITLVATASVVSGVDKGIRRLSELNLGLGMLLILFVLLVGPTFFLLSSFVQSIGEYASGLIRMTFRTSAFEGTEWQSGWTMFYWGWWISWSPFVGMFIARISRGRTIREFIAGVLLVPTLLTFVWMVIFGNTALYMELFGDGGIVEAVAASVPTALYVMLEHLPLAGISAVLATIVIATYFITSSDSGSLVIDIMTSDGDPNPPVVQKIFWALLEGCVAAVLLVTGGLGALQTAAITTALPFCVVMLFICWSIARGLNVDSRERRQRASPAERARSRAPGSQSADAGTVDAA